ncbi:MAG: azurin [Chitinophagaceae bacterium]
MKRLAMISALGLSLFFVACNNGDKTAETKTTETGDATTNKKNAGHDNTVAITANDQLKFDKIEIKVNAGEKVTLTLTNIGKMPKDAMGHNFILLKDGTDLEAFEKAAIQAPDHIPTNMGDAIIAHTKLLGPGESDTIEFTVPAGDYTFICSFPGHYKSMTGVLTAE